MGKERSSWWDKDKRQDSDNSEQKKSEDHKSGWVKEDRVTDWDKAPRPSKDTDKSDD